MDQVNAMQQYISKLKQALIEKTKSLSDLQIKYDNENTRINTLEENLATREIQLSNQREKLELLEIKVDEYEEKLKCITESKKSSFLGKMFNNNQIDQYIIKIKDLEQSLTIQQQQNEELHAQIFSLKQEMQISEQKYEQQILITNEKFEKLKVIYTKEKIKYQDSQKCISQLQSIIETNKNEIIKINNIIDDLQNKNKCKEKELEEIQIILQNTELDLRKMNNNQISQNNEIQEYKKTIEEMKIKFEEIQTYILGQQQFQEQTNVLLQIMNKTQDQITNKELYLQTKIENYNIFKLSQEKILKLGKQIETLTKKNKQLQDKLQLQKTKEQ